MKLVKRCEPHGMHDEHWPIAFVDQLHKIVKCPGGEVITDPDAILAALAEAGVLEVEEGNYRYVSKPKEAK